MRARYAFVVVVVLLVGACAGDGTSPATSKVPPADGATSEATTAGTSSGDVETTTASDDSPPTTATTTSMAWQLAAGDALGGEGDQVMSAVTAGGPGLVAVGWDVSTRSAAVWTSTEGSDWSRVPHDEEAFGGRGDQWMFGVSAGGPGLVAVGAEASGFDRRSAVWTSPDGISWSRVPHDEAVFGGDVWATMNGVVGGGPGLVAVGYSGRPDQDAAVWTSTDGLSWTRVPADDANLGGAGNQEMRSVIVGGPGLVAVGREISAEDFESDATVWTSVDGVAWTRIADDALGGDDDQEMFDLVAGGPGLVAVGLDWYTESPPDAAVWTSADGTSWSRVPHDAGIFGGPSYQQMMSVTTAGSGLVAVGLGVLEPGSGYEAAVWVSADGISWSPVAYDDTVFGGEGDQVMNSVVSIGSTLVAVGSGGPIDGLDGVAWTVETG